ncbi:MAG: type I glutamate--ammonia ligase [Thermoprotei archaeon]|jgi:glutamine synthetase|nr:type I glutamate--ammonia ligase [Thermoprotei archaeon]
MSENILSEIESKKIRWVNLLLTDIVGQLHLVTISSKLVNNESLREGFGKLDGSSVPGFKEIFESDLVLKIAPDTFKVDPFFEGTGDAFSLIYDMFGKNRLGRDPRFAAEKSGDQLKAEGYTPFAAAELEFHIFDEVKVWVSGTSSGYIVRSKSAGFEKKKDYSLPPKGGYYVPPPIDDSIEIRKEISEILEDAFKVRVEAHHHEVGAAGQGEINFEMSGPEKLGDSVQIVKYVSRMVAVRRGKIVTFMPKPIQGDNGSGMHIHVSLWKGNKNAFYEESDNYAMLSQEARYFIGGLLYHGRALSAIVSPTVNSYKRLLPGYEAPIFLAWSRGNRSAAVRIPSYYKNSERTKRIEYRPPDPSANPYLAVSAVLMAGLDGIKRKIDPGDPVDENIYHMPEEKVKALGISKLPSSLDEALKELESDFSFLLPVFAQDLIEKYIEVKREELRKLNSKISPAEFYYYLNI